MKIWGHFCRKEYNFLVLVRKSFAFPDKNVETENSYVELV